MKLSQKQVQQILDAEIAWIARVKTLPTHPDMSDEYLQGFTAGIEHAKQMVVVADRTKRKHPNGM